MSSKNNSTKAKIIRISVKKFQENFEDEKATKANQQLPKKYQFSENVLEYLGLQYASSLIKLSEDFFIKTNEAIQSFKSIYLYENLIEQLSQSICNQFQRQDFNELKPIIVDFMNEVKQCVNEAKEMKEKNLKDNYTIKQSFNNRVQNYFVLLYNLQISQKMDEIERKCSYRDYVSKHLKNKMSNLQQKIDQDAKVISQQTVKEKINPLYEKVHEQNNEILLKHERALDDTLKNILIQCKKTKKERMVKLEMERLKNVEKKQKINKQLGGKYKNLAGILINPFTYFELGLR